MTTIRAIRDFPSNPSDGDTQVFGNKTYTWNATKGAWQVSSVSVSASPAFVANSISSHLIPSANVTYDLGHSGKRFRDLYLSGNSIVIGSQSITASNTGIVLPAGTTIGGGSVGSGADFYSTIAELPLSNVSTGQQAFVDENNRLYIWNGSGWFSVGLVNTNPNITTGGAGSYYLETDGTPTVITLIAEDPEGFPITWSYSVTSGTLANTATVTQSNNVFTITPSTLEADAGTFSLTFTASDGVNIATDINSFTLSFAKPWSTTTSHPFIAYESGGNWVFGAPAPNGAATTNYSFKYFYSPSSTYYNIATVLAEATVPLSWNGTVYTHILYTNGTYGSTYPNYTLYNNAWPGYSVGTNSAASYNAGFFPDPIL